MTLESPPSGGINVVFAGPWLVSGNAGCYKKKRLGHRIFLVSCLTLEFTLPARGQTTFHFYAML
jgi:hypothetical protein